MLFPGEEERADPVERCEGSGCERSGRAPDRTGQWGQWPASGVQRVGARLGEEPQGVASRN